MNGIHDMGGMQDMGPIDHEPNEPTFHQSWEGRVYAMARVLWTRGGQWNLDAFRHGLELLPPAEYLRLSYYERWFAWMIRKLVDTGDVAQAEIDASAPAPDRPTGTPFVTAPLVATMVGKRPTARRHAPVTAQFKTGERVRARNMHPPGHTRLPRYVRGRVGVVLRDRGVYLFPDTRAHDLGDKPQHLYSVRFSARELWGEGALPRDFIHLDMWDDYLERP